MSVFPQVFTDFSKNFPTRIEVLAPNDEDAPKRETPEYQSARLLLIDQLFKNDSISRDIIFKTNWVVLLRNLPEVNDTLDANNFVWFAGHYKWDELVMKVIELQSSNEDKSPCSLYIVPTIGQSDQLSCRHELTYNAFISPKGQTPFNHLVQRHQRPPEAENIDEELFAKSDICTFPTLESLNLQWEKLMDFTNEQFEYIEKDNCIEVYILKPTNSFKTSIKHIFSTDPKRIDEWYDVAMLNFLPLIPYPATGGQLTKIPLILIDPIEVTPPSYNSLISLVDKINEKFSTKIKGETVRAIKGVIRYWQLDPNSISEELVLFANNGNAIPERSPEFNKLFFNQLAIVKDFIIEEICNKYLKIKRPSNDYDLYKDAPAEIDEELEKYSSTTKMMLMFLPEEQKNEYTPIYEELKNQMAFWFEKSNLGQIYTEFKVAISKAMNELLQSQAIVDYLKISNEENGNESRHKWLSTYYDIHAAQPLLYCLWPTVYANNVGIVHEGGEKNPILEEFEKKVLANVSTNSTIPEARGKPIPPKVSINTLN